MKRRPVSLKKADARKKGKVFGSAEGMGRSSRRVRYGVLGSLIGLAGFFGLQHWESLLTSFLHEGLETLGFRVESVFVTGRHQTSRDEILKAARLGVGQSLFLESPVAVKDRLEKLPWVQQAQVERRLPHTIWIRLKEKKPLAIWQNQGVLRLIDKMGAVITCSPQEIPPNLMRVVGEKASLYASELLELLESFPGLQERVAAAVYLRVGRWDLHLKNGWIVKLPEKYLAKALQQFLAFEQKTTLPASRIASLDLRFQGAFVLKLVSDSTTASSKKKPSRLKDGKEV